LLLRSSFEECGIVRSSLPDLYHSSLAKIIFGEDVTDYLGDVIENDSDQEENDAASLGSSFDPDSEDEEFVYNSSDYGTSSDEDGFEEDEADESLGRSEENENGEDDQEGDDVSDSVDPISELLERSTVDDGDDLDEPPISRRNPIRLTRNRGVNEMKNSLF
jgi:hypothetical protein